MERDRGEARGRKKKAGPRSHLTGKRGEIISGPGEDEVSSPLAGTRERFLDVMALRLSGLGLRNWEVSGVQ